MRYRLLLLTLPLLLLAGCLDRPSTTWTKVSDTFMQEDKPYGPGDFRVREDYVLSMKLVKPEITFKPVQERITPDRAEPTEQWMYNSAETLNRTTVRMLAGPLAGTKSVVFEAPAQSSDWWYSKDGRTVYLMTDWMDYVKAPSEQLAPHVTKLFKSSNGGGDWQRLNWPDSKNVTHLRFLDSERGYLIGWGPHIWRTQDGGASWSEIPVPDSARDPANPRKQFDLVSLGNDDVLRIAFATSGNSERQDFVSRVYSLRWGEDLLSEAFQIDDHTIVDIADHLGHIYVLAWKKRHGDRHKDSSQTSVIFYLGENRSASQLHAFPSDIKGYALYRTPQGRLLLDGIKESGWNAGEVTALSHDEGKSWIMQNEGGKSQGGHYDTVTGTSWRVKGYALYKREIP